MTLTHILEELVKGAMVQAEEEMSSYQSNHVRQGLEAATKPSARAVLRRVLSCITDSFSDVFEVEYTGGGLDVQSHRLLRYIVPQWRDPKYFAQMHQEVICLRRKRQELLETQTGAGETRNRSDCAGSAGAGSAEDVGAADDQRLRAVRVAATMVRMDILASPKLHNTTRGVGVIKR